MISLVHIFITFSFARVSGSKCTLETIAPSCPENEARTRSHNKCLVTEMDYDVGATGPVYRRYCDYRYQGTLPLILTPSDQEELDDFGSISWLNIYYDENYDWQWRDCWRYNRSNQGAKTRYQNFDSPLSKRGNRSTCVLNLGNGKWRMESCTTYAYLAICELWWDPSTAIHNTPIRPLKMNFKEDTLLFTCTAFTRRTRGTLTWSVYSEDNHLEKKTSVQEEPQAVKHPRGLCLLQLRSTMSFNLPQRLPAKITVACFTDGIKDKHRKCHPSDRLNCSSLEIDSSYFNKLLASNIGPIEIVNDPSIYPVYNGETLNYTIKARLLHNKVTDTFRWFRNTLGVQTKIQNGEFRLSHTKGIINDITILTSTILVKMEPSILGTAFHVFSYKLDGLSQNCRPNDRYCYLFKPIAEPPKASARISVCYTGFPKAAYYGRMVKFICHIKAPEGQNKKVAWTINLPDKEPKLLSSTNPSVKIFPDEFSKRGDLTSTLHVSMRKSYNNFSVACFGYEPSMFGEDGICDTNSSYCDTSDNIMGVKGPNETGDISEVGALVVLLIANLVLALLILLGCLYYNCGTRNDPVKEIDDLRDEGSLFDARDDAKMTPEMLAGDPMLITVAGEVVDHRVSIDTTSNAETSSTI